MDAQGLMFVEVRSRCVYVQEDAQFARVGLDTRLDNRVMDLRVSFGGLRARPTRCIEVDPLETSLDRRHLPTKPSSVFNPPFATSSVPTSTRSGSSRSTRPSSREPPRNPERAYSRSTISRERPFWRRAPSWPSRCVSLGIWRGFTRLRPVGRRGSWVGAGVGNKG